VYKYYQVGSKSTWVLITDQADTEQTAIAAGARKLTILSLSEPVTEQTDQEEQKYSGDFYTDIDCANLALAILAAILLVNKLVELGVPLGAIQIYASGKKGFHILVPASIFSSGRPMKNLPFVYKEMALELYVSGMDFQVYSRGRGVCWRIPNIKRDDGNYRVPITSEELFEMTVESYRVVVSTPRILPKYALDPSFKAAGMEALMERAKKRVRAKPSQPEPVSDEQLAPFREDPPACISDIADYKVKPSRNFNEVSLQMGIFIARSGMPEPLYSSLMSRLADNGNSSSYSTPNARLDHLNGLVGYLQSTPSKQFSCNAIRSVISTRPCPDCDLCKSGEEEAEAGEDVGLVERADGYYVIRASGEQRISTFILKAHEVFLEVSQSGKVTRRIGATVEIMRNAEVLGRVNFTESGWVSKANFKGELKGIGNLAFYGTEDDIQRIKHITLDEDGDMGEVVQVENAGMHLHRLAGKDVRVYVEPGFSINQYRVKGTHSMVERVTAPPAIKSAEMPAEGDEEVMQTLRHLFEVNDPFVVAQVLGWFSACHLKIHYMARYSQFPLLSMWGNAGSGKTTLATLFAWLNGCNYSLADSPVSMSSITPWAMIRYCSSTTTVPRILEEYNKSKIINTKYAALGETMKLAWNGQSIARGAIKRSTANGGSGATVKETQISAPLLIVSEQAPQMPALQQRSVQVQLSPHHIRGREEHFFEVDMNKPHLRRMARAMVFSALRTDTSWVEEHMEVANKLLPPVLTDRPRFSYQTLIVGLRFFDKVCTDLGMGLHDEIAQLEEDMLSSVMRFGKAINAAKMKTEVDVVMDTVGMMSQMTINGGATWLKSSVHYTIRGDRIYYDLPVLFSTYQLYMTHRRETAVIDSPSQFVSLITNEPYCISTRSVDGAKALNINRAVLELDLLKMSDKGLDISLYG
jgi:hypothetical protein